MLGWTKMIPLCCFGAFLVLMSSAGADAASLKAYCPPDKLSCKNGTDIGLVAFESDDDSSLEHGREGRYKDLVCFPQNFCKLQWLKDGLPYPWGWSPAELVDMGVDQGACNTSIEFRRVRLEAAGVYTCIVTGANGTTLSRNITLKVIANPEPSPPIPVAGDLCANHTAELGSNVNFTCEIFVGEDKSSFSYAYWMIEVEPEVWQYVPSEYFEIPGTNITTSMSVKSGGYLTTTFQIDNVTSPTYVSRYRLHASNGILNSVTHFHLSHPCRAQ